MTDPRNWTEGQLSEYMQRFKGKNQANASAALSLANLESDPKPTPKTQDESQNIRPRFRIHVHSKRRRRTDTDGISAKAVIDGIVRGGLLEDDTAATVESVTFTQEKAETEETVIEVWELASDSR